MQAGLSYDDDRRIGGEADGKFFIFRADAARDDPRGIPTWIVRERDDFTLRIIKSDKNNSPQSHPKTTAVSTSPFMASQSATSKLFEADASNENESKNSLCDPFQSGGLTASATSVSAQDGDGNAPTRTCDEARELMDNANIDRIAERAAKCEFGMMLCEEGLAVKVCTIITEQNPFY